MYKEINVASSKWLWMGHKICSLSA